jgi:uncharacterized repeat protein (TIGR03943 family)
VSRDPTRLGRGLLLLGFAAVLGRLLVTGHMVKYMAPALDPLSALTAVVLAAMGLIELRAALGPPGPRHVHGVEPEERADGEAAGGGVEEALTYLLLALVLALGLFVTPRALATAGLGGERVAGLVLRFAPGSPRPAGATAPAPPAPLGDTSAVLAYLRAVGEAASGQRVRVVGTVTRSDDLGVGEFVLLRYAIVHCVADARPVALLVVAPSEADAERWTADQWVEVEGVLAARERQGERVVTVEARAVRPVEEPTNPYLPASY